MRREGLRDTPYREFRDKSILLDITPSDPQTRVHLPSYLQEDRDGSGPATSKARKRQHDTRPGKSFFNERSY